MKTRDSLKYFMNDCRRTASDKILCNKAFNIRKIGNIVDIKRVLLKWFISFLIKKRKPQLREINLPRIS